MPGLLRHPLSGMVNSAVPSISLSIVANRLYQTLRGTSVPGLRRIVESRLKRSHSNFWLIFSGATRNSLLLIILLARICVQLDICPAIFLAPFRSRIGINGLVRAVACGTEASSRKTIFFDQILLHGVRALTRKLHVVRTRAGGVSVPFNLHNGVSVGAHLAADLIHDRTRIQTHASGIRIEVDGAMLRGQRSFSLCRRPIFNGRFAGGGRETASTQLLNVAPVKTVFGIAGALDQTQVAIHVLRHAEDVGVI